MNAGMYVRDDEDRRVPLPETVRRVVSLVPSLTEAVGVTAPGLLVGATDWCTHPPDLDDHDVTRVRGTKNPDIDTIVGLRPDLVLANAEENKPGELEKLRAAGLAVYVTDIRTVDGALRSLERMLAACGLERPAWIDGARAAWDTLPLPETPRRAVVPIWRKPWMAVGSDTFTGAVLDRLGVENVLGDSPERYPRFDPADLPAHDLVVLPDEPYTFTAEDGPESFAAPSALVSGRLLTWYGPSLLEAARVLPEQLGVTSLRP
ncbi:ABC transporter substrate-binding protein [Actinomycetospora sp. NBRC 106375]|uniref:helical backbone metal receptor n=1 Tax=Actinomycetospora sp. NBRC 106375 TaxID=3032207 RepID=UPI0024A3746A|nr:helical backbone metal receptor [Actinomycetospora sp. NBRC 106375]GLZ44380.1 ABC transporter substrate-binding protein [Actinomycetospora sp. NBRC 106375]